MNAEVRLLLDLYRGDRVRRRGFEIGGTVTDVNGNWVAIRWDYSLGGVSPAICHTNELETVNSKGDQRP